MPRSAANADAARTTCSGARSRARKVLSPSSQPRPRRLPAGRRHLFSGVVIATRRPARHLPSARDSAADDGTAKEQEPSTSERNGLRAPVPAASAARPRSRRCVSRRDPVRSRRRLRARESGLQRHRRRKLLLLSGWRSARIVGYYFVDDVAAVIRDVARGCVGSYVPMRISNEGRHTRPAAQHPALLL